MSNAGPTVGAGSMRNGFGRSKGFLGAARLHDELEATCSPSALGYRDRIVRVRLREDAGGVNLTMDDNKIETLGERRTRAHSLRAATAMSGVSRSTERRKARIGLKVIHQHRVGTMVVRRVSELVLVQGRPIAIPEWINLGGVRTPLYVCELELSKLR